MAFRIKDLLVHMVFPSEDPVITRCMATVPLDEQQTVQDPATADVTRCMATFLIDTEAQMVKDPATGKEARGPHVACSLSCVMTCPLPSCEAFFGDAPHPVALEKLKAELREALDELERRESS